MNPFVMASAPKPYRPLINNPFPFKGLNIRFLIVIPIKGMGVLIMGLHWTPALLSKHSHAISADLDTSEHSLNSLKGVYMRDCIGDYYRGN